MSPSNDTVALTGASGSVGSITLEHLLSSGYKVNAILRSLGKSQSFIQSLYPEAVSSGRLQFTEIPDMSAPGAFDQVFAAVDKVIHVATPLSAGNFEEEMFTPARLQMENLLSAAHKSPRVKRVVVTGSIVSTMKLPEQLLSGRTITSQDFNPITKEEALADPACAYQYSKVSAEQQAWAYILTHSPSFDLIFLLAPSILGRSIHQHRRAVKTSLGGMSSLYRSIFDQPFPQPTFPFFQDVDDVAAIHVRALDTAAVQGNKRYLHAAGVVSVDDVANRVRGEFPELKERVPEGRKEGEVDVPEGLVRLDLKESERVFGKTWRGAWESARLTVLDILASEREFGIAPNPESITLVAAA